MKFAEKKFFQNLHSEADPWDLQTALRHVQELGIDLRGVLRHAQELNWGLTLSKSNSLLIPPQATDAVQRHAGDRFRFHFPSNGSPFGVMPRTI
jgi:hypothetical protein